jgi:hypothetical protein
MFSLYIPACSAEKRIKLTDSDGSTKFLQVFLKEKLAPRLARDTGCSFLRVPMRLHRHFFSATAMLWALLTPWGLAQVNPANPPADVAVRGELARPLQAAREALQARQPLQALRLVDEARAVASLSTSERVLVERMSAVAAQEAQQDVAALAALEYLTQSAELKPVEKLPYWMGLVQLSQRSKDYPRLVLAARDYLQAGGTDMRLRLAMLQALSLQGQHRAVVQEVLAIDAAQATAGSAGSAGKPLAEAELRLMGASQLALKDQQSYMATLKLLVTRFPSKDYWVDLVSRLQGQPGFNRRYELDAYDLLEKAGGLDDADDVITMANLALKAGLPAQALRVLEQAYSAKILGSGAQAPSHAKLREQATQRLAEDDKTATPPSVSANGNALAQWAKVLASKSRWTDASATFAKALAHPGLSREAETRLQHGVTLFKAGQYPAAREALASVRGDATALELAALWTLLIP